MYGATWSLRRAPRERVQQTQNRKQRKRDESGSGVARPEALRRAWFEKSTPVEDSRRATQSWLLDHVLSPPRRERAFGALKLLGQFLTYHGQLGRRFDADAHAAVA